MILLFFVLITLVHLYLFKNLYEIKHKSLLAKFYILINVFGLIFSLGCLFIEVTNSFSYVVIFEYVCQIAFQLTAPTLLIIALMHCCDKKRCVNKYLPLYILPVISLILIWTNHYHNLFYENFSLNIYEIKYNLAGNISMLYLYICQISATVILAFKILKKQLPHNFAFALITMLLPVLTSIAGQIGYMPSVMPYLAALLYSINIITFTVLTLKPKFLDVTSFTIDYALDNMSQAYMILDESGNILRTNKTFNKNIGQYFNLAEDTNIYSRLAYDNSHLIKKFSDLQHKITSDDTIDEIKTHFYFNTPKRKMEYELEVHKLKYNNDKHIANIFLFKDMTTHREHFETIRKQKMLMYSQDQLATIGILASSFANDIDSSLEIIENGIDSLYKKDIFSAEEKELLSQMKSCTEKIDNISKNVSTSFSASSSEKGKFNICDTILEINQIVASELKKYNVTLKVNTSKTPILVYGSKVKFNQIITNIVVNAIQAYDNMQGGLVTVNVHKKGENAVIEIVDNAGGIDPKVAPYLFKNILTTKGTLGTGLGLHFSYTLIKGEFNGDITFVSKNGETKFTITLPYKKN